MLYQVHGAAHMTDGEKTLTAQPGGELARAIEEALTQPVRIGFVGTVYRIHVDRVPVTTPFPDHDPEAAQAASERCSGSWADSDPDTLIADIYRWREAGSRPSDRP